MIRSYRAFVVAPRSPAFTPDCFSPSFFFFCFFNPLFVRRLLESEVVNNFRPPTHTHHQRRCLRRDNANKDRTEKMEAVCIIIHRSITSSGRYIVGTLFRPIIGSRWLSGNALASSVRPVMGQPTHSIIIIIAGSGRIGSFVSMVLRFLVGGAPT